MFISHGHHPCVGFGLVAPPFGVGCDFAGSIRRKTSVRGNLALLTGLVIVAVFSFDL